MNLFQQLDYLLGVSLVQASVTLTVEEHAISFVVFLSL
jgi:hypothetical protein